MVTIRQARESDAAALLTYLDEIGGETDYLTFGAGEFQSTVAEQERVIATFRDTPNQLYLLAETDGRVVGVLTFEGGRRNRTAHRGEFGITVRRSHWNDGIGTRLLTSLIEWATASDIIRKIELKVGTENEAAIALYRKCGFRVEGNLSRDLLVNGEFTKAYYMGLAID